MTDRVGRFGSLIHVGTWTFAVRAESLTVSPDADHERVFSFDLEGRPISWFENECLYKRSLASEVHGREQFHGARRRWRVGPEESGEMFARILQRMADAPVASLDAPIRARIADILRQTPESLLAERARFDAAYRPISILPPDQYLAIVLQATFGCSWNQCAFCDFYQDRPFRARSLEEFRDHALAVNALLGRAENLRKRIFLADGNALVLSNERLRPILDAARAEFPGRPVSGFVDVFTGERKDATAWQELRSLGLERVHIGLETGHDPLLRFMNKPGSAAEGLDLVAILKQARIAVSVILICGVGGHRFAEAHERDTIALLSDLPLGAEDIVYLSPFVEHADSGYARKAADDGVRALTSEEIESQYVRLRDGTRRFHPKCRIARYDIREFVY